VTNNADTIATLHYMAPECMLRGYYSAHSDIYAFGILAWELLHEREAFEGLNEFNLINSIVNEGRTLKFDESISLEISQTLSKCFSPIPEDRPSAKVICTQFSDFLKSKK